MATLIQTQNMSPSSCLRSGSLNNLGKNKSLIRNIPDPKQEEKEEGQSQELKKFYEDMLGFITTLSDEDMERLREEYPDPKELEIHIINLSGLTPPSILQKEIDNHTNLKKITVFIMEALDETLCIQSKLDNLDGEKRKSNFDEKINFFDILFQDLEHNKVDIYANYIKAIHREEKEKDYYIPFNEFMTIVKIIISELYYAETGTFY